MSRHSLKTFLSHATEKTPRWTLLFRKNSGINKLHEMVYHGFVENWFSHSTEKLRRGFLQFSEKYFYRKIFMARRGISRLSLETSLSHTTEKSPKGTLFFRKFLDQLNCIRSCTTILSKIGFLTVPKFFEAEPFNFEDFSFIETFYG